MFKITPHFPKTTPCAPNFNSYFKHVFNFIIHLGLGLCGEEPNAVLERHTTLVK